MFIALLQRQSATIYRKDNPVPVVINMPINLVANLEVSDKRGLTDFLSGFLKSNNIEADEGVLLLSEEVNFCQSFPNDESDKSREGVETFLSLVPFSKNVIVSKEFVIEGNKLVCATNRGLCTSVIYGFQAAGLKVTMVLPAFVVGVNEQTVFGKETIEGVVKTLGRDKPYSMLTNIFEGEKKGWWQR